MKSLSEFLRPEFLSRVDEIVVFRPLDKDDFQQIAGLMLDEYVSSFAERGIRLTYDDKAKAWLAEHAIGGKSGARDLRNLIRRKVEDPLAMMLIEKSDEKLSGVALSAGDDGITMETI